MCKTTILVFVLLVTLFLALPVHAHPGRTDKHGGHIDTSTGQYHYHHGKAAHQHFDIDGSGSPDCPLTFDGSSNSSQSPLVGIAAATCVGIGVTAGALSKPKDK